ncbi:MAG: HD domain-containing protein [Endomicrobiia bacterium]
MKFIDFKKIVKIPVCCKRLLLELNTNFDNVYVVGGVLRDLLLGKNFFDIDLIIKNLDLSKLQFIVKKFNLPFIILDEQNRVYRVVFREENFTLDISDYKDLDDDLYRRDFTINTLCIKLSDFLTFLSKKDKKELVKNLVDKFSALKDIEDKILRITNEKVLKDDPLRILRIARFITLGFKFDEKFEKKVLKEVKLLPKVAKERVVEELKKIFLVNSYEVIEWLDKVKVLETIFPEIKVIKIKGKNTKFRKFYFHKEGLWQHIKLTYKKIEFVLENVKKILGKESEIVKKYFEENKEKIFCLKISALFHDIAKPYVIKKINGRIRFFYHETKSKEITAKQLKKLRLSNDEIDTVSKLVENHMRIGNLCHSKIITDRAIYRLFNELGDVFIPLIILSLADRYSYDSIPERKKDLELNEMPKFIKFVRKLIKKWVEYKKRCCLPKIVDGNIIMKKFNISEGPLVGKILKEIREQQLLNKIKTSKEAIDYVQNHLLKKFKKDILIAEK